LNGFCRCAEDRIGKDAINAILPTDYWNGLNGFLFYEINLELAGTASSKKGFNPEPFAQSNHSRNG
jgi:hypothetical protein